RSGHAGPARRRGRPGPAERAPRPRPGPPVGARDTTARPHARSPGERGHPAVGTTAPSAVSRQRAARCPVAAPDPRARLCAGAGCRGACAQARRPVSPGQRVPAARQRRRGRGPRDGRGVVTSEQASFARQLERLEEIVRRLEAEDLDLDQALKLFEEGVERLRPTLVFAAYEAVGGTAAGVEAIAASVEVVHAYSLVHDDLPCMDNDDLRRGRPTTHRAFDVATATRAGYHMVALAARVLAAG